MGRRLPGNLTTFSLNTSDAEMTELKYIKPLTQFQHLDNNGIHFNIFYFRAFCYVRTPDMHFVGASLTPADIA
jgi:hypothetical protein